MSQSAPSSAPQRSGAVFWALILIAAGVIWLLREANIFTGQNLAVLFRLWPLILIALGLELLVGRGSRSMSLLIVGGTILILVVLMFVGPSIGLTSNVEIKSKTVSAPIAGAESATISVGMAVGPGSIYALNDSDQLIVGDLRYIGDVTFNATGGNVAQINLSHNGSVNIGFDFLGWTVGVDDRDLHWNVGLTPSIPIDLTVDGGVGDNTFDLTGLQLTRLNFKSGVGDATITLPALDGSSMPVQINGGVGKTIVNIPNGTFLSASIDGGVGETDIDVPDNAPVRVETSGGLSSANVPSGWTRISGDDRNGVWESPAYAGAASDARIDISYNGGVGSLRVY